MCMVALSSKMNKRACTIIKQVRVLGLSHQTFSERRSKIYCMSATWVAIMAFEDERKKAALTELQDEPKKSAKITFQKCSDADLLVL